MQVPTRQAWIRLDFPNRPEHMTPDSDAIQVHAVVPAAGQSRRMGRPKQLLPVGRSTMVAAVVKTLLEAGVAGVVVVTRTDLLDALDLPADPRVQTTLNDDPDTEMLDSVRIGVEHLQNPPVEGPAKPGPADGLLVLPVDMPAVFVDSCRACIRAFTAEPDRIIVAAHAGRRGHPIIFPIALVPDLENLPSGLRSLLDRDLARVKDIPTQDPNVTHDINTMDDYNALDYSS